MLDDLDDLILWGILLALVVAFLFCLFFKPILFLRIPLWLLCHTLYKMRVFGRDNVPATGSALLVCNHVSSLDWFFLLAAQRRHIHFVIYAGWTKIWGLRTLLRWAGVIPIDKGSGPRAIVKSLRTAADYLARGELVCIFAEGRFTRTGFLLPFHRGFEQIVKHHAAPIIPVCLEQVWGSIFSFWGGKHMWKFPQELPYPVTVAFGKPMPATASAVEVRLAIQKLSADCAVERTPRHRLVHQQFLRLARRWSPRTCLREGRTRVSYGHIRINAITLARRLQSRLADASALGLWLSAGRYGVIGNVAAAILGKTTINFDYQMPGDQLAPLLTATRCRHVLTSRSLVAVHPFPSQCEADLIFIEDVLHRVSLFDFLAALLVSPFTLERRRQTADAPATIMLSNRRPEPTPVLLTHGNLASDAASIIQGIVPNPRDRFLVLLPFSDPFGYMAGFWLPLQVGASIISLIPVDSSPGSPCSKMCEIVRDSKCTILLAPARILRECLDTCDAADFKSVRLLWSGGEGFDTELVDAFKAKFGITPLRGYGCAELGPVAAINVPDSELEGFKQIGNRPGTIGQPLPGIAARIVNPETFEPVPAGQVGLLLIYGPNVMAAYLGQPEETQKVLRDGWYVTGDRAKYDDDGFITLANEP